MSASTASDREGVVPALLGGAVEDLAIEVVNFIDGNVPVSADDVERLTPVVMAVLADIDVMRDELLEYRERLLVAARCSRPRVTLARFGEMCGVVRPTVQKWIYAAQEKYPNESWGESRD